MMIIVIPMMIIVIPMMIIATPMMIIDAMALAVATPDAMMTRMFR